MEQAIKRAFIGELLKRIRTNPVLQNGETVTQTDIAKSLGIKSKSMVSMMEAGKASPPLERIREFSHAYNTADDLTYILFRDLAPICWEITKALVDDLTYKELITWNHPAHDLDYVADFIQKQYAEKVGLDIPIKRKGNADSQVDFKEIEKILESVFGNDKK